MLKGFKWRFACSRCATRVSAVLPLAFVMTKLRQVWDEVEGARMRSLDSGDAR